MSTDAAYWNQVAEKYARQPLENPAAFERKIAVTKASMSRSSTVLDIGCGTGSLALRLAPHAAHVHGLDLSPAMIRIAQAKAAAQALDNVTFHIGPFDESFTALEAGSLDGICAYSLLHLLEARAPALSRIYQLLKPGGFFVSSTVCLGDARLLYGPLLRVMRWLGKAPRVTILAKRTVEDELREAGFRELSQPDVGAKASILFLVATKPSAGRERSQSPR